MPAVTPGRQLPRADNYRAGSSRASPERSLPPGAPPIGWRTDGVFVPLSRPWKPSCISSTPEARATWRGITGACPWGCTWRSSRPCSSPASARCRRPGKRPRSAVNRGVSSSSPISCRRRSYSRFSEAAQVVAEWGCCPPLGPWLPCRGPCSSEWQFQMRGTWPGGAAWGRPGGAGGELC